VRGTKLTSVLLVSTTTLLLTGVAAAESVNAPPTQETNIAKQPVRPGGIPREEVGGSPQAGPPLDAPRTDPPPPASTPQDLDQQKQNLDGDLEAQQEAAAAPQSRLERRAKPTHTGEDLASVPLLPSSLFGWGAKTDAASDSPPVRILSEGRESVRFHRDSRRASDDAHRRPAKKKKGHREPSKEQGPARSGELRREPKLQVSIGGSEPKKEQMEARIAQLRAEEAAGLFERPPASAGEVEFGEQELGIVTRGDVVALPVEPIPHERYVQIFKASAKRYGFARDWYVLAAVAKVESNHGENMGPSSAGAMGPMQFLPSTWREYGVDGNKDGVANIMDPEDAIPAAAAYLEAGGAPDDWYAALYTYNHAGWYVRKVLGVAEGYRRLAQDDEVESYI
jgi:hypothetical protein